MTIRLLKFDEIDIIQNFLLKNWRSSVLDKNKDFFIWSYCRKRCKENTINFVADINEDSKTIKACLGVIENNNFSDKNIFSNSVWLTNWKSTEGSNLSGIKLLKFVENNFNFDFIGTIGCNELAKNLYKILGYKVGKMNRYISVNFNKESFEILDDKSIKKNKLNSPIFLNNKKKVSISFINNIDLIKPYEKKIFTNDRLPFKDISYIKNRYFDHPIYSYKILLLKSLEEQLLIVLRKCFRGQSFAFRIVDIIGNFDVFNNYSNEVISFLFQKDAEYIDLYTNKLIRKDSSSFSNFFEISNYPDLIIPGYFEPFVYSNPTMNWAYKINCNTGKGPFLFKGDCDQDRPA